MTNSIVVEWYPAGEYSPFPDKEAPEWAFSSHEEFKEWVQGYVCVHCLVDFLDFTGREPETLKEWLGMGCGCEIGVTDESGMIRWDDKMIKTEETVTALNEYREERNDNHKDDTPWG
jgi:hypothetical protein